MVKCLNHMYKLVYRIDPRGQHHKAFTAVNNSVA
jgi:hypothetical protein